MTFPDDDVGDVLRAMHEHGVDLVSPRLVDFEHVFPNERAARAFADEVGPMVAALNVSAMDGSLLDKLIGRLTGSSFDAQCKVRMVPTHETITATQARLADVARQFGGKPDGWGSLSNTDGSPAEP